MIGAFVEVFVDCPPAVCEQRDSKGLWRRARAGELRDFTGVTEEYEPPLAPEVVCRSAEETPDESAGRVIAWLEVAGWIAPASGPSAPDTEFVKAQLRALDDA
jgi:adenylylsulfate kinase